MKKPPTVISFLDLVFSLLGATTILTVVLSITAGRSEHQLERDYIRVTIHWEGVADSYGQCILLDGSNATEKWSFQIHPRKDDKQPELVSVFFFSPAKGDTWRIRRIGTHPFCRQVVVETKRETTKYPDFSSNGELTIETRE